MSLVGVVAVRAGPVLAIKDPTGLVCCLGETRPYTDLPSEAATEHQLREERTN